MNPDEQDPDLEAELELTAVDAPQPASATSQTTPADGADVVAEAQAQWVWQYGAPAPPPSFGARFFSGTALRELYRFFACGLLVVLGCLLPWGPSGEASSVTPPPLAGYETPAGALSLVIGLWLVFSACYGIYTSRQKILPVFLMIEPAVVSWLRTLDAWGRLESDNALDQVQELFMVAGTGVLLTLLGSTYVALQFVFLLGKVYAKKDDKGGARRAGKARAGKGQADEKDQAKDKAKDRPKDTTKGQAVLGDEKDAPGPAA